MSITPWQTRWDTLGIPKDTAIQGEIDELRAALQERDAAKPPAVLMNQLVNDKLELSAKLAERDAEIERLKHTVKKRDVGIEICGTLSVKMEAQLAAQRKVLKQALEAFKLCRFDSLNMTFRDLEKIKAAITAIQEVLK